MNKKRRRTRCVIWIIILMVAIPPWIFAQGPTEPAKFKQEELDQMLAPIALYPDSVLGQVLMASTYPLEIVQADRWVKANKNLKGEPQTAALEKQGWDPSVKSLVNFPQVLSMMSEKLDWTQRLGDAFLAQQKEVMDSPETSSQGKGDWQPKDHQGAERDRPGEDHRDSISKPSGDLRPGLQPGGGVWRMAVSCIPSLPGIPTGLRRCHRSGLLRGRRGSWRCLGLRMEQL
jgi:hypothetical protein